MEQLWSGVQIAALGIGVVFAALSLIAVVLSLFGPLERLILRVIGPDQPPAATPHPAQPVAAPAAAAALTPELVAVITAAATAALNQPVRIRRIRYANDPAGTAWVQQGRLTIMASHRPKQ
jgi:Na+-transporting methylmalonyl-CoA/oxaloacetate decarboxylase gamma subunit